MRYINVHQTYQFTTKIESLERTKLQESGARCAQNFAILKMT